MPPKPKDYGSTAANRKTAKAVTAAVAKAPGPGSTLPPTKSITIGPPTTAIPPPPPPTKPTTKPASTGAADPKTATTGATITGVTTGAAGSKTAATATTDPAPIPTTKPSTKSTTTSLTDPDPSTTASVPTSIEPTEGEGVTEVKVYGNKRMFVETEFDEKTYKLKPGQELLAKNLRLQRYAKKKSKEPKWMVDILKEIVIQKCRDDPQIMLTQPCINFREYLEDLMIDLFKTGEYDIDDDEKWELKVDRDKREKEKKKATRKAKATAVATAAAAAAAAKDPTKILGNTRLLIKIPFSAFRVKTAEEIRKEYYDYTLPRLEQLFPKIDMGNGSMMDDGRVLAFKTHINTTRLH